MNFLLENPEESVEKLWKSRETILEVLFDRGYEDAMNYHIDLDEFKSWITTESNVDDEEIYCIENINDIKEKMTLEFENSRLGKIIVLWPAEPKLGTNIRNIASKMEKLNIKKAIVIIDDSVTNWCETNIRDLRNQKIYITVYKLIEAQINIMKHKLVPKHQICSTSEKIKLCRDYSLKTSQFPTIKFSDPVVRHLGARKGQIIKITRNSETQKGYPAISYRVVL